MGTTLSGAVQVHHEATEYSLEGWWTVALFEFNKDYECSGNLYDLKEIAHVLRQYDKWIPEEAEYSDGLQVFSPEELTAEFRAAQTSPVFASMIAASEVLRLRQWKIRLVFWRD
jgi:hypothetical protein